MKLPLKMVIENSVENVHWLWFLIKFRITSTLCSRSDEIRITDYIPYKNNCDYGRHKTLVLLFSEFHLVIKRPTHKDKFNPSLTASLPLLRLFLTTKMHENSTEINFFSLFYTIHTPSYWLTNAPVSEAAAFPFLRWNLQIICRTYNKWM